MKKGFAPTILVAVLALVIAVGGVGIGLAWRTDVLDKVLPPNIKEMFGRGEEPEEEPGEKPEEDKDWKTYSNPEADFTFEYPPDWKIKEDYLYETAAGVKAEHRTVVLVQVGKEANEISINVPQFACEAEWVGPHWIGTCSKASEVLEVLDGVVSSFQLAP